MHFMHAAQMISLLNVYMLITEFTFYSLTMCRIELQITVLLLYYFYIQQDRQDD